jgi:RNA polymerase sigma factor (sigma-70 family)
MANPPLGIVVQHVRRLVAAKRADDRLDQQLLESFAIERQEAAFTALVQRHGTMVLGVCQRVLNDWHDAEDAFQATFLVLARKATAIRNRESVASWLYAVAYRVALKARVSLARRRKHEQQSAWSQMGAASPAQAAWQELRPLLDEELARLPDKYRAPLVLCYLQGKTRDEAAQQLGWTQGMVKGRLERGRDLLRSRLARRGLTLSAALLVPSMAPPALPAAGFTALMDTTVNVAMSIAAGQAPAIGALSASAAGLAEGVLKTMLITRLQIVTAAIVAVSIIAGGTGWLTHQALAHKSDEPKRGTEAKSVPADAPRSAKDEDAIQGTWYVVRGDFNGNRLPPEDLQVMKMAIEGNRISLDIAGEKNERVTFKLDPSKKPKAMIVTVTEGAEKKSITWIYDLEGKRLTICGTEKPDVPTPTKFAAPEGSNLFVMVLERDRPKVDPETQKAADQKVTSRIAQVKSTNNLKQLALALHNYHATFGTLPPAAIYSKDGKPLLSWRVAILPFIEQDNLYKQFHLDEAWDSDHNKTLLAQMPKVYAPLGGAAKDKHSTFYQVFVGKGTAFEGKEGTKFQDFSAGVSNTFLVVEAGEAVPWTKPSDLPYVADQPLPKLGGMFKDLIHVAMADGSVRTLPANAKEETIRSAIVRTKP